MDREFLKREIDTLTSEQIQQVAAFIHAIKIASPPPNQVTTDEQLTDERRQILFNRFKASKSQSESTTTNNLI